MVKSKRIMYPHFQSEVPRLPCTVRLGRLLCVARTLTRRPLSQERPHGHRKHGTPAGYRVLPQRRGTRRLLERVLEDQRQLWNAALEERVERHRKIGRSLTSFDQ